MYTILSFVCNWATFWLVPRFVEAGHLGLATTSTISYYDNPVPAEQWQLSLSCCFHLIMVILLLLAFYTHVVGKYCVGDTFLNWLE